MGTLVIPDNPYAKSLYNSVGKFHAYVHATSSLTFFLRYCKKPDDKHLKWYYQFKETFDVNCRQKIKLIPHIFLEMLQKYCKHVILGILQVPDCTYPKWYYQLVENVCIYLQAKNKLLHSVLYWDLYFKESYNLIGQQHFGQLLENLNFARYGIDNEMPNWFYRTLGRTGVQKVICFCGFIILT